jgi:hypothetical protein
MKNVVKRTPLTGQAGRDKKNNLIKVIQKISRGIPFAQRAL